MDQLISIVEAAYQYLESSVPTHALNCNKLQYERETRTKKVTARAGDHCSCGASARREHLEKVLHLAAPHHRSPF